jgi:hypothetical protein
MQLVVEAEAFCRLSFCVARETFQEVFFSSLSAPVHNSSASTLPTFPVEGIGFSESDFQFLQIFLYSGDHVPTGQGRMFTVQKGIEVFIHGTTMALTRSLSPQNQNLQPLD